MVINHQGRKDKKIVDGLRVYLSTREHRLTYYLKEEIYGHLLSFTLIASFQIWSIRAESHAFRNVLPLHILIQQRRTIRPLLPHDPRMLLASRIYVGREVLGRHEQALCEFIDVRRDLRPVRTSGFLQVETPQHPRNAEEQGSFGYVHSLTDASTGSEDELVALGWVGICGGFA